MNCPKCSSQLQILDRLGTNIDYCQACQGVWLDKGELEKITQRQIGFDEQHYRRYHSDREYGDYYDDYYDHGGYGRRRGFFGDLFDF